ncbi:MAG: hypothetical protein FJ218_04310 [Ignavibacteria bacterium]|nr:hypothetical protein [Ignavibacteria bacterium]
MKQFVLFIIAIFFSTTAAYSQKAAIKVEAINNGDLSRVSILLLGINNGIELPKEFALKQNYPNIMTPENTK